jgi:threonine aldolase
LETCLHEQPWIDYCLPVETNIVVAVLKEPNSRDTVIANLANKGIRCMAFGPGMLRFVTHLGISSSDIDQTVEAIKTSTFM